MSKPPRRRHRHCRFDLGVSLIEVLVVLVLFSVGLIGMVGLQARAVQVSVSAEDSARAALLANDIASRMWGARSVTLDSAAISDWNARVADPAQGGLPNGVGTITVAATPIGNVATINVAWRAPHEPSTTVHAYQTQVSMP